MNRDVNVGRLVRPVGLHVGLTTLMGVLLVGSVLTGCKSSAVGDPCDPEAIPEGGFNATEAFLETSSVQCRTRVCLVYKLSGDPSQSLEDCEAMGGGDCDTRPPQSEIDQRVYCSCRCSSPPGSSTPTCSCPGGFTCVDVLELGGPGIEGGYCVREDTPGLEEELQ